MTDEEIEVLEFIDYLSLLEGMAVLNGRSATPAEEIESMLKTNQDYFMWHNVISEARYEEAKEFLEMRLEEL